MWLLVASYINRRSNLLVTRNYLFTTNVCPHKKVCASRRKVNLPRVDLSISTIGTVPRAITTLWTHKRPVFHLYTLSMLLFLLKQIVTPGLKEEQEGVEGDNNQNS